MDELGFNFNETPAVGKSKFSDGSERMPLAARMRPRTLEEYCGQTHILGEGKLLRRAITADNFSSIILSGPPGVGKTSLVVALAKSINCPYKRIQFTPDVMPSDIAGFSIYNQKTGEFEFREGSAMSNIILADEINRASAKTQSALLEVMEEWDDAGQKLEEL